LACDRQAGRTRSALQEIDDLAEFILGFIDAGDIGKGHAGIGLDIDLGLALADRHQPAAPTTAVMRRRRGGTVQSRPEQLNKMPPVSRAIGRARLACALHAGRSCLARKTR